MRFICTADWHIRATRPICRTDEDWYLTQEKALDFVAGVAREHKCNIYIIGDIFDRNSDVTFRCLSMLQNMAKSLIADNIHVGVLAGNHDLLYHASENLDKSAIGVFLHSDNVFRISELEKANNVAAVDFDQETLDKRIIFKHVLCFPHKKNIPYNVDALCADDLLKKYKKAEWIFTGDYHRAFHYEIEGRHVVNPGCLLRQAADMSDYAPCVLYIDTEKAIVKKYEVPDNVEFLNTDYLTRQGERETRIEQFAEKLAMTEKISLDYLDNVQKEMRVNKFTPELEKMINELIESKGGSI